MSASRSRTSVALASLVISLLALSAPASGFEPEVPIETALADLRAAKDFEDRANAIGALTDHPVESLSPEAIAEVRQALRDPELYAYAFKGEAAFDIGAPLIAAAVPELAKAGDDPDRILGILKRIDEDPAPALVTLLRLETGDLEVPGPRRRWIQSELARQLNANPLATHAELSRGRLLAGATIFLGDGTTGTSTAIARALGRAGQSELALAHPFAKDVVSLLPLLLDEVADSTDILAAIDDALTPAFPKLRQEFLIDHAEKPEAARRLARVAAKLTRPAKSSDKQIRAYQALATGIWEILGEYPPNDPKTLKLLRTALSGAANEDRLVFALSQAPEYVAAIGPRISTTELEALEILGTADPEVQARLRPLFRPAIRTILARKSASTTTTTAALMTALEAVHEAGFADDAELVELAARWIDLGAPKGAIQFRLHGNLDARIRELAAEILGQARKLSPELELRLAGALRDPDEDVRIAAMAALDRRRKSGLHPGTRSWLAAEIERVEGLPPELADGACPPDRLRAIRVGLRLVK